MKHWKLIFATILATGVTSIIDGKETSLDKSAEAMQQGKHLFLFFYKDSTPTTQRMQQVFDEAVEELNSEVLSKKVSLSDPAEKSIVEKFNLHNAPMPLAIVLAPNGVMVRGFPQQFSKEQLVSSLVTPSMATCLKALQEQKLVFLCIQGKDTKNNEAAMLGVKDFQADPRFNKRTQVIVVNPRNADEESFIRELGLTPNLTEATTVMMSPPAAKVGSFVGPTDKQTLISTLMKASKGCGPGGCPNGCK